MSSSAVKTRREDEAAIARVLALYRGQVRDHLLGIARLDDAAQSVATAPWRAWRGGLTGRLAPHIEALTAREATREARSLTVSEPNLAPLSIAARLAEETERMVRAQLDRALRAEDPWGAIVDTAGLGRRSSANAAAARAEAAIVAPEAGRARLPRGEGLLRQRALRLLESDARDHASELAHRLVEEARAEVRSQAAGRGELAGAVQVWVTTLDERTCPVCSALDGAESPLGGTFRAGLSYATLPPAHPRCRCRVEVKT